MNATPSDTAVEATFAFVDLAGFTGMTELYGAAVNLAAQRGRRSRRRQLLVTTPTAMAAHDRAGRYIHFCGLRGPVLARFAADPDRYLERASQ